MRRRGFLASLGAGSVATVTGCLGRRPQASPTGSTTPEPPVTASGPPLRLTAEPLAESSADRPARVRVSLTNTGDPVELTIAGRLPMPSRPGEPVNIVDSGANPVLLPAESDLDRRYNTNCWTAPIDDPDLADDAPWDWGHGDERTVTLAAGERRQAVYHVVNSWPTACFANAVYRFERHFEVAGEPHERAIELELPIEIEA